MYNMQVSDLIMSILPHLLNIDLTALISLEIHRYKMAG